MNRYQPYHSHLLQTRVREVKAQPPMYNINANMRANITSVWFYIIFQNMSIYHPLTQTTLVIVWLVEDGGEIMEYDSGLWQNWANNKLELENKILEVQNVYVCGAAGKNSERCNSIIPEFFHICHIGFTCTIFVHTRMPYLFYRSKVRNLSYIWTFTKLVLSSIYIRLCCHPGLASLGSLDTPAWIRAWSRSREDIGSVHTLKSRAMGCLPIHAHTHTLRNERTNVKPFILFLLFDFYFMFSPRAVVSQIEMLKC